MKNPIIYLPLLLLLSVCLASCKIQNDENLKTESFVVLYVREGSFVAASSTPGNKEYTLILYPDALNKLCSSDTVYVTYPTDARVVLGGSETVEDRSYGGEVTYRWSDTIQTVTSIEIKEQPPMVAYKPVIYLYPTVPTECSVKVTLDGKLTCTYPAHGTEGWQNFIAHPDGTLTFPDGRSYYCLYWEGELDLKPDFSTGFCVKGEDTAAFLENVLAKQGLNEREANEFIIYWLPRLQENPYNLFSFKTDLYTSLAELSITPAPDCLLRVYMTAVPSDTYMELTPQTFEPFERKGFTVVEWGGTMIEE